MRKTSMLCATIALIGCTGSDASKAGSPAESDVVIPDVLATIGADRITPKELNARIGANLDQLDMQYRLARSRSIERALDDIVREKLFRDEARKQRKTVDELIAASGAMAAEPSASEVEAWYGENLARTGGQSLDQLRGPITELLRKERREAAERTLEERLYRERNVSIKFQPYRLTFDNAGAPSLGKEGAPVQVIEFSDFQCPYCRVFAPTLKQIESSFGDRVHVVYRQYPIPSIHPFAVKAAEASLCAHEQGKFWQLHDAMFNDQKRLAPADLKNKARQLALDQTRFDKCLDTGRYAERVQKDMSEGARLGVNGTPAVFVNGILVEGGAVPYETVALAIRKELTRRSLN